MHTTHDIIIVGGGIVGLTLACALAQQTNLSLLVLDAQVPKTSAAQSEYHRVSAITLASQRIFSALGVWENIKQIRVSPFTHIMVWDGHDRGEIEFDCKTVAETALGFIVENEVMQAVLYKKLSTYPQVKVLAPIQLQACSTTADSIQFTTTTQQQFTAKIAVAADGARSWLREQAEIPINQHDYEQTAIVATVSTALPHQKMARQVFLESGPLAFLPLVEENLSSIVWSVPNAQAKTLLALSDEAFKAALAKDFSYRLGEVLSVSQREGFPLHKQTAKHYLSPRIALVGDAAHTVHPLAGQGVNLGLLDAAALVEVIVQALQKGRDFSSFAALRPYERWRKADNMTMLAGIDTIKALFAANHPAVCSLRSLGLKVTNQTDWIKNFFIRQAIGDRTGLPKLALKSLASFSCTSG